VKEEENKVYDVVEQQPKFNGNINQWLAQNLKYPPVAAENGIEGRVIVQFVVGKDGGITNATVVRGVDSSLDKEALRVVNSMPKWVPGKQNGQSVNCKFTLPVVFRLQ
ncbi:MAG: energy transducer TonB, partial [Bacteroidaceae bacterium]|nr:energy transducer TonB [Bacteroidaceae bacterium]